MASNWPILSLLIWLPIAGGLVVIAAGEQRAALARLLALVFAGATFILSILLYMAFDPSTAAMATHALQTAPFWLMIGGFVLATLMYLVRPSLADRMQQRLPGLHRLLENKFYFDELYQKLFVSKTIDIGNGLWKRADAGLIDGWLVNGSARLVSSIAARVRVWQSGYLFHYAFAMIIGLIGIIAIWVMLK